MLRCLCFKTAPAAPKSVSAAAAEAPTQPAAEVQHCTPSTALPQAAVPSEPPSDAVGSKPLPLAVQQLRRTESAKRAGATSNTSVSTAISNGTPTSGGSAGVVALRPGTISSVTAKSFPPPAAKPYIIPPRAQEEDVANSRFDAEKVKRPANRRPSAEGSGLPRYGPSSHATTSSKLLRHNSDGARLPMPSRMSSGSLEARVLAGMSPVSPLLRSGGGSRQALSNTMSPRRGGGSYAGSTQDSHPLVIGGADHDEDWLLSSPYQHPPSRLDTARQRSLDIYDSFDIAPSEFSEQIPGVGSNVDLASLLSAAQRDLLGSGLTVEKALAHGSTGLVYQGEWRNLTVAVKVVTIRDVLTDAPTRIRERAIIKSALDQSLQHPNVVTLHTAFLRPAPPVAPTASGTSDVRLYLVQEFCDSGTLAEAIDGEGLVARQDRRPDMPSIVSTALDVACGMSHIHSHNLVHGNLGPHNIMLQVHMKSVWARIAKVCDWGVIKLLADCCTPRDGFASLTSVNTGRSAYLAPELFTPSPPSCATDVYAFGVTLWEMYNGKPPWRALKRGGSGMSKAVPQQYNFIFPEDCPAPYANLARECMHPDPATRPNFFNIVQRLITYQTVVHTNHDQIYIHCMGTIKLERRPSRAAAEAEQLRAWRASMEVNKASGIQRRFSTGSITWPMPRLVNIIEAAIGGDGQPGADDGTGDAGDAAGAAIPSAASAAAVAGLAGSSTPLLPIHSPRLCSQRRSSRRSSANSSASADMEGIPSPGMTPLRLRRHSSGAEVTMYTLLEEIASPSGRPRPLGQDSSGAFTSLLIDGGSGGSLGPLASPSGSSNLSLPLALGPPASGSGSWGNFIPAAPTSSMSGGVRRSSGGVAPYTCSQRHAASICPMCRPPPWIFRHSSSLSLDGREMSPLRQSPSRLSPQCTSPAGQHNWV